MSGIEGADAIGAALIAFGKNCVVNVEDALEADMLATQREAVELCPVHTGKGRDLLASPAALTSESAGPGQRRWTFRVPPEAFYLLFVEFGTKSYEAGDVRSAGKDKRGNKRTAKVKRSRPAHRAYPFFRPAVANLMVRLRRRRGIAKAIGAAKEVAGFIEQAAA